MKNTVSKGILFYLLILLGIVLGVACILMCILMFSPGAEIFGISYFKHNNKLDLETFKASETQLEESFHDYFTSGLIETIEINSNYVSVDISNTTAIKFSMTVENKISGLSNNSKTSKLVVNYNYDKDTKTFSINATGPDAFLYFSKISIIKLNVPRGQSLANKKINIVTKSGNVAIANHEENDITLGDFNANIGNGQLYISSLAKTSPSAKILVEADKNGKIETKGKLTLSEFRIRSKSSKVSLSDIDGNLTIDTEDSTIRLKNVSKKLLYSSDSGVLEAKEITGDFECSELVNIANIFIDKVGGTTMIPKATASTIEIKVAVGDVLINTTSGGIKIGELNADAELSTQNGQIVCLVNSKEPSEIKIQTKSGNIDARFRKVSLSENAIISTEKGRIYFQYATGEAFALKYECSKNKPNVSQGITTGSYDKTGTFAIGYDPSSTAPNTIEIKNNDGKTEFANNLAADYVVLK